jgi:DNA repair exonuclease SbcCD nuclease subunit
MKIAFVTDIHMGCRRGSEVFLKSHLKFFKNQFIPDLKERKIDTIIIPGDFFDNRLALDSRILDSVLELFENDFKDFKIYIIVGNHDSYLESSIHINSLKVLEHFSNVTVFEKSNSIKLANKSFYFVPWVTNSEKFLEELSQIKKHDICVGHFNFSSFLMHKGQECEHGLPSAPFFEKFKLTISGHFHTRSEKVLGSSRIVYIGNPFHMTRNDIDDPRGYSILNTDDLSLEFVENTQSIKFVKYFYPQPLEEHHIKGNHVDIFINIDEKTDEKLVDKYFERLEKFEPAFPINKKTVNKIDLNAPDEMQGASIPELINEYVNAQTIENKEEILEMVFEFYNECKNSM